MQNSCDLLIVGGGIIGLWIARRAVKAGLSVAIVEKARCGSGASGGLLGALMPHMPTQWSPKKQFQFEALTAMEDEIKLLEEETGQPAGYNRAGRLIPIRLEHFIKEAERRIAASLTSWTHPAGRFIQEVRATNIYDSWISADAAPLGLLYDDLSAQVEPRRYINAMRSYLQGRAGIIENWTLESYDADRGIARSTTGNELSAGHVVLTAGTATFPLLESVVGHSLGGGIKGQAALFRLPGGDESAGDNAEASLFDPQMHPIIYDGGVYIVRHDNRHIAVGSTTEKTWENPTQTDQRSDAFIARAREICVPMRDAREMERWANVRPRGHVRDPMIGRLPGMPRMSVATGTYKISFGIAHYVARWFIDDLVGASTTIDLPPTFHAQHHAETAAARKPNSVVAQKS